MDVRQRPLPVSHARLLAALSGLRTAASNAAFPLPIPSAAAARQRCAALVGELDGYLVPRVARREGPVLAVVSGPTGAGKSTLVNSLVRAPVSPAGVLRPTTHTALLVCHPDDAAVMSAGAVGAARGAAVVLAPALRAGLALVDSPDINSVVDINRELASTLLATSDLWLFVTTAARYADAVPWQVLHQAWERGTAVAMVLDRLPAEARFDVAQDLHRLLREHGLGDVPLFLIVESTLDRHGLLPEAQVASVRGWLEALAGSEPVRHRVVGQTVSGAVGALPRRADQLARAAQAQADAAAWLRTAIRTAENRAMSNLESGLRSGVVLRGDLYSASQQVLSSAARSADDHHPDLAAGLGRAVVAWLGALNAQLVRDCCSAWRSSVAGRALLTADPTLTAVDPMFVVNAEVMVSDWQAWVRTTSDALPRRGRSARPSSLAVMVAATAGEQAASATKPVVAAAAQDCRHELLVRLSTLLAATSQRYLDSVVRSGVDIAVAPWLRQAASRLREAAVSIDQSQDLAA